MNVLFLPLSYTLFRKPELAGGDRTHIVEFTNALADSPGVGVTLLYPDAADRSQFSSRVRVINIASVLPGQSVTNPVSLWTWNALALRLANRVLSRPRFAEAGTPDVLYVRFAASSLLPLALLRVRAGRIPIILEINTPALINVRGILGQAIDSAALRLCSRIAVVTRDLQQLMSDRYGETARRKIFVNPNGADTERFKPLGSGKRTEFRRRYSLNPNDFLIGYSGVALPHHRLEVVARCIARLGTDSRLVVAGNTNRIDAEFVNRQAPGQVSLLGQLPYGELREFLNACDALVLPHGPSYGGILHQSPVKLFEYMAMAKPVIASRLGQIAEVIQDRENGLLFDWEDEDDLTRRLAELKENPNLGAYLGTNARATIETRYTWKANARRFLSGISPIRLHPPVTADLRRLPGTGARLDPPIFTDWRRFGFEKSDGRSIGENQ